MTNREDCLAGDSIASLVERALPAAQYVIAADGGARISRLLGLSPHIVVGDLDSLSQEEMSCLAKEGTNLVRFPSEKDQTDSHLAMSWAARAGFQQIDVIIQSSGRLDHVLGTIWAAAAMVEQGISVRFLDAGFEAVLVKGLSRVYVSPATPLTVSLIPIGGTVHGVTISGLKYPLNEASLGLGESRGISNETVGTPGSIQVRDGWLLVTAVNC